MTSGDPTLVVDPERVLAGLRELQARSGDEHGAQRAVWTPPWDAARAWLLEELARIPGVVTWRDGADNLWAQRDGADGAPVIAIGSHLDSVPDGGRLDGCLGVVAGLEVLRAAAESGWTGATLRLVDWADEEGRFEHSLLGSSAATGRLDVDAILALRDRDGIALADALAGRDVTAASLRAPGSRLDELDALLELHIEQGPVLEERGVALAAPTGSTAIRRLRFTFDGQSAHAGTTPLDARRDAALAAARLALEARELARAADALATTGSVQLRPGMPTVVAEQGTMTLDVRHADDAVLDALVERIAAAAGAIATGERVHVAHELLWSFPAVVFDAALVGCVRRAIEGPSPALVSGALHDAVAVAHHGVPTAMVFVRSIDGISHSRLENSTDADLRAGVRALARATTLVADALG